MWRTVKLGEVLELQNGYAFKSKEYSQDGFFLMRITNVQQGYISAHNPKYIQIASASKLAKFILEEGDILVSLTGDMGRVGVIREEHLPAALNQRVARVQSVDASLDSHFLFHYLNSAIFRNQVEALGKGAAQANVSTKEILEITLELPPLAEQKRIVAKLDVAFAEIDEAVEDSKKQETEVLKFGYRAINNKLKNLANIYSSKALNDVVIIQPKKKLALEKISESDDVSFMGMKELGIEQKYTEAINTKPLNEVFKSYQYFEENDVVFAKITPCYENGKLGIMKNLKNGIGFGSSEFVVLRPNSEVHGEYIYYCLLDETFRKNGTKNMSGAVGHKRVTKDYYFNYQITVPPLSMQIECIKEFDEIWKQAEIISKLKHKKINELISLKSAILKQELQHPQSEVA